MVNRAWFRLLSGCDGNLHYIKLSMIIKMLEIEWHLQGTIKASILLYTP
jgi:hypothetical protein